MKASIGAAPDVETVSERRHTGIADARPTRIHYSE
jgi:hypothetical protein